MKDDEQTGELDTTPQTRTSNDAPFKEEVAATLTRLRSALADVIAAVPEDIGKGADLHRALHIDRKLSWRVFKIANAADPISVGPHVPSRANMATFFRAAKKRGVPDSLIESAARLSADFEKMVVSHAGDRATFDSMVSALAPDETAEQIDLTHRRLAFRGQRHILGQQAKTKVKMHVIQPSDDPGLLDVANVEGLIALRRLRSNAECYLSSSGAVNDDGSARPFRREALDPDGAVQGMALLREFCSQPLPSFRIVDGGGGHLLNEIVGGGVGKRAAVTCLEGHISHAVLPRYREELNDRGQFLASTPIPAEVLVFDLLFRDDCYPRLELEGKVVGDHLWRMGDWLPSEGPELFAGLAVTHLGKGPSVLHSPDVPRYPEIGRYVFERTGWDGDRFDVYRCRVEYPVVPSTTMIHFPLPYAPDASK